MQDAIESDLQAEKERIFFQLLLQMACEESGWGQGKTGILLGF